MKLHRLKAALLLITAASLFLFISGRLQAGMIWEAWTRACYSKDMSAEWLVAEDKDWDSLFTPDHTAIHLLVPPIIRQVDDHWEITFDAAGKKKTRLEEHFDNVHASHSYPSGYRGIPRDSIQWPVDQHDYSHPWLIIRSKEHWNGKYNQPNVDSQNTGTPYEFNLDPEDAFGISFLEPVITEKDGEWLLTTAATPTDQQMDAVIKSYAHWIKVHPGPKSPKAPKIHYSAKMQKESDDWLKALHKWQDDGAQGESPLLEDTFHLTAEQKKQYDAWERAKSVWYITGGDGPFPQPIDFIKDDEPLSQIPANP